MKIEEIKSYKCSDGEIFDTKAKAEEHEKELNNPEYKAEKRIAELERKILELEAENATLSARITALEAKNSYPWSKPHPDVTPFGPYQQPFNPMVPTPKLPAEPGNIMFYADPIETSKLSDEELMKKGYRVSYCGDKRCVLPPFENPLDKKVEINIDSVRGNATTPPEYKGNPLDNQDCGPNYNNSNVN